MKKLLVVIVIAFLLCTGILQSFVGTQVNQINGSIGAVTDLSGYLEESIGNLMDATKKIKAEIDGIRAEIDEMKTVETVEVAVPMPTREDIFNALMNIDGLGENRIEELRRIYEDSKRIPYMYFDTSALDMSVICVEFVVNHGWTLNADIHYNAAEKGWRVFHWNVE